MLTTKRNRADKRGTANDDRDAASADDSQSDDDVADRDDSEASQNASAENAEAWDVDDPGPTAIPAGARTTVPNDVVTIAVDGAESDGDTDTVDLAVDQIEDAREDLNAVTWDSGNVLAGLAALLPQVWLGGAQNSLERWQENHSRLQEQFAATVDSPIAHWIAGQRIEASIQRTVHVQVQLASAAKFLDVVGLFGPREAMPDIAELIGQAAENGLVYQVLDLDMETFEGNRVNPIMALSINGGAPVRVLIDTGSYGLVINPQVIGLKDLGPVIGTGSGCYASCTVVYDYDIYNIPIATDGDIESARTPVQVVTLDTWQIVADNSTDYEGILGVGPKAGPGESNPLTALPGLLGRGILLEERRGRAILGPNPYAARVTIEGSPNADLMVKVGDNDPRVINTLIDSGGVVGSVPTSLLGGADTIPPGTLISVYTKDGSTLLFSYRTTESNSPNVTTEDRVIMGFPAFAAASIYTDFSGEGKTIFNYA
jgi:hypothetical protein